MKTNKIIALSILLVATFMVAHSAKAVGLNYFYPAQPHINYIVPNSGPVGITVTIYGSGFTPTGNTVYLGNIAQAVATSNGKTISFKVSTCPYYAPHCPGAYIIGSQKLYVANANGTSNAVIFNVTKGLVP